MLLYTILRITHGVFITYNIFYNFFFRLAKSCVARITQKKELDCLFWGQLSDTLHNYEHCATNDSEKYPEGTVIRKNAILYYTQLQ